MRLLELNPRFIHPNLFVFECPCGCKGTDRATLLSAKNAPMTMREQYERFERILGDDWNRHVVPCKADFSWTFPNSTHPAGEFEHLTVTPSIDASASGHWHGFITNGEIR